MTDEPATGQPALDHRRPAQPAYAVDAAPGTEPRRFVPLPPAHSGWDPALVNGSASSGLIATLLEQAAGDDAFAPARLTVDLLRPVPYAPVVGEAVLVRAGRRLRIADATLTHDGTVVARASGVFLRTDGARTAFGAEVVARPEPPHRLTSGKLLPDFDRPLEQPPFQHYCDVRWASAFDAAQPTVWIRPPERVVDGMPRSDLARAAAAADLLAGLIATHQTRAGDGYQSAINADQQIVLAGAPAGDWFALRLDRLVGVDGTGFAAADLFDESGYRGRVQQSRVVNVRQPAVMRDRVGSPRSEAGS